MLLHSTDTVHPRDRLAYWLDVATKTFVRHSFSSSAGSSFIGSLKVGQLADLGVAAVKCSACDVGRSVRDIAQDSSDDLIFCLQLAGSAIWEQDGRQSSCSEQSFLLIDTGRPFSVSAQASTTAVTVAIPRRALEARLGDTSVLNARALDSRRPLVQLAARFLAMLPGCIDGLDRPAASKLAEQTLDLLTLVLSDETGREGPARSSARAVALLRLKSVIGARLCDPELKPAEAAAAAGISVRYANALLAQEGTSMERYIQDGRLERCRRALEDPTQSHRTISDIAFGWGFSDLSHFCRRFKAEFGCSPSEYRQQR